VLGATKDPDGRTVVLLRRHWVHIVDKHPDLDVDSGVIIDAVAAPDRRVSGPEDGEEWFYRRGVGPSRWLRVVVHYEHDRGVIATAFARRAFP
jgi:hypothetical protein